MADAQTDEPLRLPDESAVKEWRAGVDADRGGSPSTPIADLAPAAEDKSVSGLVSSLTQLQRQKVGEDVRFEKQSDEQQARDRTVRNHAFQMEGVAASEIPKPWDAEKEHKKWETNPIDGFGSMGGLFAMVASAFTKAPMENAMNGLAGAINSTREGQEQGYQRAYDVFKENVKLADQRFKTQHELYTDALSLGTADAAASDAKFRHAAVKFGDQQMLMLAEHGMVKEIYELQASRAAAHEQMIKSADAIDLHTIQKAAVDAIKKNPPQTGDPVQDKIMLAAQVQRVYDGQGKYGSAEQEAVGAFMQKNMNKSAQEIADGLAEIHQSFSVKAPNIAGYQEARQAEMDANEGKITPEKDAQLLQAFGLTTRGAGAGGATGGNPALHPEKFEIDRRTKQYTEENIAKGMPPDKARAEAFDRAVKEVASAGKVPSGNAKMQLDAQFQKAERMESAMDEMEVLLGKHKLITGLGGTLTRPIEAVWNVLGSNETDKKQFQRVATELKEWGQSVVNDRTGRPLSSEAKDASVIFAGLNPGDTTPNTLRAIVELRPVIKRIKEQLKARGEGRGPVSGGGEPPAAPAEEKSGKQPLWMMAPVKGGEAGKQSSADDSPPVSGARKAPDGNWYVDDPKRPGKYLQVQVG